MKEHKIILPELNMKQGFEKYFNFQSFLQGCNLSFLPRNDHDKKDMAYFEGS